MTKQTAKRRIEFGIRNFKGPRAFVQSAVLRNLAAGAYVRVYRKKTKQCDGTYTFISVEGETAIVQMTRGRRIFRSTCVRPCIRSQLKKKTAGANETDHSTLVQKPFEETQKKREGE